MIMGKLRLGPRLMVFILYRIRPMTTFVDAADIDGVLGLDVPTMVVAYYEYLGNRVSTESKTSPTLSTLKTDDCFFGSSFQRQDSVYAFLKLRSLYHSSFGSRRRFDSLPSIFPSLTPCILCIGLFAYFTSSVTFSKSQIIITLGLSQSKPPRQNYQNCNYKGSR